MKKSFLVLILAFVFIVLLALTAFASTLIHDDFNTYDQTTWFVNYFPDIFQQTLWGPDYGNTSVSGGVLSLKPSGYRTVSILTSRLPLKTLPVTISFRIMFPGSGYRNAGMGFSTYCTPPSSGTEAGWYFGSTNHWYGGGQHVVYPLEKGGALNGHYGESPSSQKIIPTGTWLDGEIKLYKDRVETCFNDETQDVYFNVQDFIDWTNGIYPSIWAGDDYNAEGFKLDYFYVDEGDALTIDSLIAAKEDCFAKGWISSSSTVHSLDVKLNAAKAAIERGQNNAAKNVLGAFKNEVSAQSGKTIKDQAVDLLIGDANALIATL